MSSEWDDIAEPEGEEGAGWRGDAPPPPPPLHHLLQQQQLEQQQQRAQQQDSPAKPQQGRRGLGARPPAGPGGGGNSPATTTPTAASPGNRKGSGGGGAGNNSSHSTGNARSITQKLNYTFPTSKLRMRQETDRIPLVLVACGSYSPVTHLHLRMFEIALDFFRDTQPEYEVMGGYFSPVSDAYAKPGLASWQHRTEMLHLATRESTWIMVDDWEASQTRFQRTATVLDHFHQELNGHGDSSSANPGSPSGGSSSGGAPFGGAYPSLALAPPLTWPPPLVAPGSGCLNRQGRRRPFHIMLLAGGDLIQSFAVPNLWKEADLNHILGDYGCVVIERTGADVKEFLLSNDILYTHRQKVYAVKQFIHNDISSTKVRLFCKRGMSIRYLLPDPVIEYIQAEGLYSVHFVEKTKKVMD